MAAEQSSADFRGNLGRYALYGEIAAGGMATVHIARLLAQVGGFSRTVAIKRLHPHLAKDPDFVGMFLEEARLAARVSHPNVVTTLDVVSEEGELFLVMEYVPGESLSRLVRKSREAGKLVPPRYAVGIVAGALDGLHAAHEAKSEKGVPLGLVHRDVSPQNIHVGTDGVPRVLDFGIAKATNRVQETRTDQIKGKVAYMSPEQLAKGNIDRRADVYSASVVLWEALTGQRLFKADDVPSLVYAIVNDEVRTPSSVVPGLPSGLDEIIMKGLSRDVEQRWATALEMAEALEAVISPAPPREIGGWVEATAGEALAWRQELVHRIESETASSIPPPIPRDSGSPIDLGSGVRKAEADALTSREPSGRPADEGAELARASVKVALSAMADAPVEAPPPALPPRPSRSWVSVAAGGFAAALLLAFGAFAALRWSELGRDAVTSEPSASASAADSAEPAIVISGTQRSARAGASAPPPPAGSTSNAGTPASASARPWASAPTAVTAVAPTAAPSSNAKPPPSVRPHDDCDSPFVVDSRGIRHPKPHCFKR